MTQLPQGTALPLEVGGAHVVEHQRTVFQMPLGQFLLDLGLALPQPVHRRVEGLGIDFLHLEPLGQGARARFLVEPPSRRELGARVEPCDDHRHYSIAFFGRWIFNDVTRQVAHITRSQDPDQLAAFGFRLHALKETQFQYLELDHTERPLDAQD